MDERYGAKQPERFDPARAARLDDPERLVYLAVGDVLSLLDAPRGTRLLDFGTGTGTYALEIARLRPDLHVIAFDEQPEMLDMLQAKLRAEPQHNVTVMPAGSHDIPVVERVLALNVLHELGDSALRELAKAVAVRGRALFIDWNGDVERPVGPPKDHVYGVEDARARLRSNGFTILQERLFPYHYALLTER